MERWSEWSTAYGQDRRLNSNCRLSFRLESLRTIDFGCAVLAAISAQNGFCPAFRKVPENEGTEPLRLPLPSPDLNAHIERFVRSIKSECLAKMIFFGEKALRRAVGQYLLHYHAERNHQGLGNAIIEPADEVGWDEGDVQCRERLGGILRYYYREAA